MLLFFANAFHLPFHELAADVYVPSGSQPDVCSWKRQYISSENIRYGNSQSNTHDHQSGVYTAFNGLHQRSNLIDGLYIHVDQTKQHAVHQTPGIIGITEGIVSTWLGTWNQ